MNASHFLTALILFVSPLPSRLDARELKIATYNVYFLDENISSERKHTLQNVIEGLDADVIAFQEINNRAALSNILPAVYQIAILDDPLEIQEVALAVREPLKLGAYRTVFPDREWNDAFPRKRDLLQVEVQLGQESIFFLVHHPKSRRRSRLSTDKRRARASELILKHISTALSGKKVILLGDFNDNPDDRSLNILEQGDPEASGGVDTEEGTFLFNATESLLKEDICSYGYRDVDKKPKTGTFNLTVPGSRAENNRWRGIEHHYWRDVKVKAILFDQILVTPNLKSRIRGTGVFNHSIAVTGRASRIKFSNDRIIYTRRGSFASDHVPVWILIDI
jgi:endonuclease/exonuclease/phosphatase family metal-dependent hydrolase